MKYACAGLLALLAVGCFPSYKFTPSGPTAPAAVAKPAKCDFQIVNLPPARGFEEIGTLTSTNQGYDSDPEKFKKRVQADVCRVGGDVVFTEINAKGWYIRGTVLRKVADDAAPPAPAPAAPPAS